MIERVIIDVASGKMVRLKMAPDQHRSSLCDDISCDRDGRWDDVKWAPDGKTLALRLHLARSQARVVPHRRHRPPARCARCSRKASKTYYESGNGMVNWPYLPRPHEAVWFSERNNWGNLYLYDLKTGKLQARHHHRRRQCHRGADRWIANPARCGSCGVGRTPGMNPYYQQFWKVSLDGGKPTLLTPGGCRSHDQHVAGRQDSSSTAIPRRPRRR